METKSFKQMIQAGDIKRADAMKSLLDDIHEEEGFNVRTQDDAFWAGIKQFAEYIAAGGTYPPLEVRPRPAGGVYLVEGHRRRLALIHARDMGAPVEWVSIVAFTGNDVDRKVRIATSATQEPLKPLEVALLYKQLSAFDLSPETIAKRVNKTRQHVDQLLILANANADVHRLVSAGEVSAAVAVNMARKHNENAGKMLGEELAKAKAAGKGKVTAGTMAPKALPPKIVTGLVDELGVFMGELPKDTRIKMAELEKLQQDGGSIDGKTVSVPAGILIGLANEFRTVLETINKQAEKMRAKVEKAKQVGLA